MKGFLRNPKTYLFLLIVLVPMLIFAVFFSNYYSIYKNLKNSAIQDSDENIIVKNPFEGIDAIEENDESVEGNKNITGEKNNPANKNLDNSGIGSPDKTEKPSYNYIVGVYKSRFEKLQQNQERKVYSLIEQAKTDYINSGSKKSTLLSLAPKYLNMVNKMEQQADKEFNTLINDLNSELVKNSYQTDIVKEIRNYYNYCKKSLKAQAIKLATKYL